MKLSKVKLGQRFRFVRQEGGRHYSMVCRVVVDSLNDSRLCYLDEETSTVWPLEEMQPNFVEVVLVESDD